MANREQLKELVQKYITENYSKVNESAFGDSQEEFEYLRKQIGDSKLLDSISSINVNDLESLLDALTFVKHDVSESSSKEDFRIYGHAKGEDRKDEKLLFSKATNSKEAKRASKVLQDKYGMVVTRIGDSDLDGDGSEVIDMFKKSVNTESVEEMSTTAGAPAPATKYAFKRKK